MKIDEIQFVRTLRTPSSERFLLCSAGRDVGALEVHYVSDGSVQATLIGFDDPGFPADEVSDILKRIDEVLFPAQSLDEHNLTFTVVLGRVIGAYTATP